MVIVTAKYWSMPLTPEGRDTLLRFMLGIIPGIPEADREPFVWVRDQCRLVVSVIELEQTEWMLVQHHVECWGVNSGATIDLRESNRFTNAVDAMLRRPPSRVVECAKPVEVVSAAPAAVVAGKQKTLW